MKPAIRKSPTDPQRPEGDVIDIMQGDDYAAVVAVTDDDGTPVDLTGYTAQAQIRRRYADYEPEIAVEIVTAIVLPTEVHLAIPGAQTALLRSGYVWDLQLVSPAGAVTTTVLSGPVRDDGVMWQCPWCGTERCWELLELPARAHNCLAKYTTVRTVDDVAALTETDLLCIKSVGRVSVADIQEALRECGLALAEESERERRDRLLTVRSPAQAAKYIR